MSTFPKTLRPLLFVPVLLVFAVVCAPPAPLRAAEQTPPGDFWSAYERNAPEGGSAPRPTESPVWLRALRMAAGLAFILGLIGLGAWLLRRWTARAETGPRSDVIRVVGNKMLGGRRSLLLVRVRGQTLLLGLTPQRITFLTEIQETEGEWAQPPANPEKASSVFNRKLGALIEEVVSEEDLAHRTKI